MVGNEKSLKILQISLRRYMEKMEFLINICVHRHKTKHTHKNEYTTRMNMQWKKLKEKKDKKNSNRTYNKFCSVSFRESRSYFCIVTLELP